MKSLDSLNLHAFFDLPPFLMLHFAECAINEILTSSNRSSFRC